MVEPPAVDVLLVDHRPLGKGPESRGEKGRERVVLLDSEGTLIGREELPAYGEGPVPGDDGVLPDKDCGDALFKGYDPFCHDVSEVLACRLRKP